MRTSKKTRVRWNHVMLNLCNVTNGVAKEVRYADDIISSGFLLLLLILGCKIRLRCVNNMPNYTMCSLMG